MPDARDNDKGLGVLTGAGALALVLCCAAPALIAGGALAAAGGFLQNPLVIFLGLGGIVAALSFALRRRATRADCCEPDGQASPRSRSSSSGR